MTAILKYDAACRAIAEAKSIDEVRDWEDKAAAVREYARRSRNRKLELDALEIREKSRRRCGQLLKELKAEGKLFEGFSPEVTGEVPRITLESLDVSKNESSRNQKIADLDDSSFERLIGRCRAYAEAHPDKHSFDVLRAPGEPVNGARSIMGSRQEPDDSLDYFPTPPWGTRALMSIVLPGLMGRPWNVKDSVWEPACGDGHMVEVIREYTANVLATDIHDYCYPEMKVHDFLSGSPFPLVTDWIITNPPFGSKTEEFVLRAIDLAQVGVAMFVRLQWLESVGRYEAVFRDFPPTRICFFAERINLCKGRWEPQGSTATAYVWLVWMKGKRPQAPFWIPPGQRERLTKPDDAARFTAHPVIRKEDYDPSTGEVKPSVTAPPPPRESPIVTQNEEPQCLS